EPDDLDVLTLFRQETYARRLLTREEQQALGQHVAEARCLAEVAGTAGRYAYWTRAVPPELDDCLAELCSAWPLVLRALPGLPMTPAAWRAALVALSLRGVDDERVAAIEQEMRAPGT